VEIHVLQGEAETVMNPAVKSLGRFHLMGIPPAPRGMPQVEVAFDIDANGIVNVSAKDLATGKEQAMTITGGTSLSKDEIDRMVGDAEKFAAEDHARRETAEARNTADQLHYQVAKFIEDNPETIPAADKDELVAKNEELKKVLDDEASEAAALTAANEALMQVYQRVGQAMVQNHIRETEDRFEVTVDLPGMRSDDVELTFEDGTLTIRGQREFSRREDDGHYHRIERSYGSFARSVRLPRVADPERIEASFDNGVLTVLVPKREEAKARTIEVTAK
jgi:HSP20 family molecular chaperone IbpA